MPICRFRSFQDTPILYFTLRVTHGLPLLADDAVPEILRKGWLCSALWDRWLVGAYCIHPDRVNLFASPTRATSSHHAWLEAWQDITTRQINEATHGVGRIWAGLTPPCSIASMDAYLKLRALMTAEASKIPVTGACAFGRCEGMIWQLLSSGEPAPAKAASLRAL